MRWPVCLLALFHAIHVFAGVETVFAMPNLTFIPGAYFFSFIFFSLSEVQCFGVSGAPK